MPGEESHETYAPVREQTDAPRPIQTAEVFRALIADELGNGRLTATRRRRIVRYAAAMGLSATEAGELIAECRREALEHPDPVTRRHALRLVYPTPPMLPAGVKLALAALVAILLDLLLVAIVFS